MTGHVPRSVLVTGAGGFIGRHLVRDQLARGRSVRAIDVRFDGPNATETAAGLVRLNADVRSTETLRPHLEACDTVFHLAAAHLDVLKGDDYFHEVNVRATGALVRAAAEAGVRRFVHCSTVGVYGQVDSLPADEATRPSPDIAYEESKLAGEGAVREAASEGSLEVVILRPSWVYGPHCPRTLKLIRAVARKRFFLVGNGANLRHPIYIADLMEAFDRAATRPTAAGETIVVAGPETVTVRRLVELIIEALGITFTPRRVPLGIMVPACFLMERIARLAGREPPFSRRSLKFFTDSSAFRTEKARRVLAFDPKIDTRQGIYLTIEHYRRHGLLPPAAGSGQPTRPASS